MERVTNGTEWLHSVWFLPSSIVTPIGKLLLLSCVWNECILQSEFGFFRQSIDDLVYNTKLDKPTVRTEFKRLIRNNVIEWHETDYDFEEMDDTCTPFLRLAVVDIWSAILEEEERNANPERKVVTNSRGHQLELVVNHGKVISSGSEWNDW